MLLGRYRGCLYAAVLFRAPVALVISSLKNDYCILETFFPIKIFKRAKFGCGLPLLHIIQMSDLNFRPCADQLLNLIDPDNGKTRRIINDYIGSEKDVEILPWVSIANVKLIRSTGRVVTLFTRDRSRSRSRVAQRPTSHHCEGN